MLLKRTKRYTIEKCAESDISAVMEFFGNEHDPKHPLAMSRSFVDWQYYDRRTRLYNIIIAKDGPTILGLLTYVTNEFFDSDAPKFIWMNNWLAKRDFKGFVGPEMLFALPKCEDCENIGTVGPTAMTQAFYKKMGYRVGSLKQYFFANEYIKEFRVLQGRVLHSRSSRVNTLTLKRLMCLNISSPLITEYIATVIPYKSMTYLENKYLKNPFYEYFAYGIESGGILAGVLIGRTLTHNGTNVVRLVEYFGHEEYLAHIDPQVILDEHNAEYMDFYCTGISHEALSASGFMLNTGDLGLVVPNHFEPFQNANIEILYAYKAPECRIFKGDGDRDHPRALKS